ncbi:protein PRR14L isoform X2 [Phyllobates terribilis]|uniref:protein PRR14L isoform X2 n=1 Tax=Phyllobates terribilis TaxID=111132 RepID=UPI003CCB5299
MLELDVLEQRPLPLNPLESSASRTITHGWPALHVPFIHELKITSDPGSLDQVMLQVNVQETLTEISEDAKFIPEPDLFSSAGVNDTRKHHGVKSAVMLDAVAKVTPLEICDSAQNMMLQESGESTDFPIREDFLQISIARENTVQLHMKDDHTLSDPISKMIDKAAGMEVMGTGSVLQNERMVNLPSEPNRDESSALEISHSVEIVTKTVNLAATKTQTSVDESPEGFLHDKCTVLKSPTHQCPACSTRQGDPVKCLEAEHLTSTQRTFDFSYSPKVPPHFHGTSICKEAEFNCINEVHSTTCLMERLELNTTDINVPSDKDMDMCLESVQQEIEIPSCEEIQNNDISVAYLFGTNSSETASTRLHDIQSDSSKVGPRDDKFMMENERAFLEDLEEDQAFKPNLPPCFENLTGAKAWDTEVYSFSCSMIDCNSPLSDGAPACHKYSSCVNSLEDHSYLSPRNILCSAPLTSICAEHLYAKSSSSFSLVDGCETEDNQCTMPQTMKLHLSDRPGNRSGTQSEVLCGMVPSVIHDPISPLIIVKDFQCLDREDSSCAFSDSSAINHNAINCDQIITSQDQSKVVVTIKETVFPSNYSKVPCQTVGHCRTPSYALVPYIDIWDSLSFKPEVNLMLSPMDLKNVNSKKDKSQEPEKKENDFKVCITEDCPLEEPPKVSRRNDCMLKEFKSPQEVVSPSQYGGKHKDEPVVDLSKMHALLAEEHKCNISADSFPCQAECRSVKVHEDRLSNVSLTVNRSEDICRFTSGALCDSSVLAQLIDVRHTGEKQTSKCFLKKKPLPHLSLSSRHLGDCSFLLPTCLSASTVSPTGCKNKARRQSEVFLDKLQLPVSASSSVQILDDLSKSHLLKQNTELWPRYSTTLEEPFKSSDSLHCMKISSAEINGPTHSAQPAVLNKNRSPLMQHMETFLLPKRNPLPVKAVNAIKMKVTRVKFQRNLFSAEIKMRDKSVNDCQLLKERSRQSAGCHIGMLTGTTENRKRYDLRPAPQSLNYSSQEVKRPKILNSKDVGHASSDLLNCVEKFSQKSETSHLSEPGQACKRKEPSRAIGSSPCSGTNILVKRQPNRTFKSFSTQENLPLNIKGQTCKSSSVLKIDNPHNINFEYKSLPTKHLDLSLTSKPYFSKMTSGKAVSQRPPPFQKCKQDHMLLNKLSRIANKIFASSKLKSVSSNLKVVPFSGVKIQARKLLNVFSCVSLRMNSQLGQLWQENVCLKSNRDRLVSQSMNLYPKTTCFSHLGDLFSFNSCDNLTFPVSFHVTMDPSCFSDFLRFNPPDFILGSPQSSAQSSELSEWTLSLFLSSRVPEDSDSVRLLTQWNPQFRSLESSSESNHTRRSVRKSGCSMLGLHTVLALSSPGCYRLWTRRRNLGSRIPTVQKHSVTQFAHGLKGSPPQFSRKKDQFSSFAFSLGRVLSTWSRHGLSTFSSDCANTHPNCSVWLPSQNSNIISVCRSQTPLIPNSIPQLNTYSLPIQNLDLTYKPRNVQENLALPFSLLTPQKDDPIPPCWFSTYKNDVELSSCSFKPEDGPKHYFVSTVKKDNFNLPLEPYVQQKSNLEHPLAFSSLKPIGNISLQEDEIPTVCLSSRWDVAVPEVAAVDLPCCETLPKSQACPFEQRENIFIPCTQNQNQNQANEGSFERKPQRVSQIRIRKTIPKPDPNLTPMGLPKPKRVNKKEFSLEDIYTNKNYKCPPPARLETIFEEPQEKNGILISVSQQKRKRILEFRDCTVPRLKRPKGRMKVMTSCKRGRKAAMEGVQLDALLIQKLMDLENCLLEEEAMERNPTSSEMPS